MNTRADRNNNPAAFTTDIARQGGLIAGTEYINGDSFPAPSTLITAKLIGDPIALTMKVLDAIGYYTRAGAPRWTYMAIPPELYATLSYEQKKAAIAAHYRNEGGTALAGLFK